MGKSLQLKDDNGYVIGLAPFGAEVIAVNTAINADYQAIMPKSGDATGCYFIGTTAATFTIASGDLMLCHPDNELRLGSETTCLIY